MGRNKLEISNTEYDQNGYTPFRRGLYRFVIGPEIQFLFNEGKRVREFTIHEFDPKVLSMCLENLVKEFLIEFRHELYGEERVDTIMHSIARLMNGKPLNPSEMYTKRIEEQERKEYERLKRKFEPDNEKLDQ